MDKEVNIQSFIEQLNTAPESINFENTMATIDGHYSFTPTRFTNGELINEAGQNNGSCKIFAFAKLHNISESLTLHLFGDYYRNDVVKHPEATDHQNIRNFIETGWGAIKFEAEALSGK